MKNTTPKPIQNSSSGNTNLDAHAHRLAESGSANQVMNITGKDYNKMVKRGLILSSIAVIILLIAAFYMISRLVVNQMDSNFEIMMKRTSSLSQSIESTYKEFLDESEFELSRYDYLSLLNAKNTGNDTFRSLRRLMLKFQDMLHSVEITDGKQSIALEKIAYNQVRVTPPSLSSVGLVQQKEWQVMDSSIVYIIPVVNARRVVTGNIRFRIDLDSYIHNIIMQDNVDKNTWILFTDNSKVIQAQTYNAEYKQGDAIKTDALAQIAKDTRQSLAGYTQGRLSTANTDLKVMMAYFPILIFNNYYSIIFCQDKSMLLSDIYTVIGILTIIFLLILLITFIMFYVFIRTLKKEENKLLQIQTAVENASDLIIITDMENQPIFVNKAFKDIFNTTYLNTAYPIDVIITDPKQRDQMLQMISSQKSWTGEVEVLNKNSEPMTCLLRSDIILDKSNAALAIMYMATDIAERKKAERMKNEFISTVSHELRTPLTSIRGSLGLIRGGVTGEVSPQTKKLVEIAYTNSERLVRLINDILDIEKIEAGKMEFHIQRTEIVPLVEKSIEMMRSYASGYNVKIILEPDYPNPTAYIDPDRFEQVLVNLISNAAKFSPAGNSVSVRMMMKSASVMRLSVTDHGMGIPDEYRAMMFKKFAQVDSSDSKAKGGTGLGLSISKAIVEKFGGTIDYESTLNQGSTFFIDIPADVAIVETDTDSSVTDNDRPQILIVEDDADIAALLKMILEEAGYRAATAPNAAEARRQAETGEFAAMTLDLMLPDKQGITLVQELRDDIRTRALPIIVVSAVADQQKQQFHGGFDILDWIQKPIDLPRLRRVLQQSVYQNGERKYSILHVEDDPDNIEIVAQILKDRATIVAATSLKAAQHRVLNSRFDLVILDVTLPDGNGMDLISYMRANGKQATPVLVFSASETPNELQNLVSASLVKSKTTNEELVGCIGRILSANKITVLESDTI